MQNRYLITEQNSIKLTCEKHALKRFVFIALTLLFISNIISAQTNLIWADEFNHTGLPDSTNWDYVDGGNWNNEAQYYVPKSLKNARIENGNLIIEAHKENFKDKHYTSARLHTIGKQNFKYGKIEIRAKVPSGNGAWPAIWMLGSNINESGWPLCGAMDIFEHVGSNPNEIQAYAHSFAHHRGNNTEIGDKAILADLANDFHIYTMNWTKEKLEFFVDDQKYFEYTNDRLGDAKTWPYDNAFDLVINLAIGGTRGGENGIDDSLFPMQFLIDYIRIYKL